MPSSGGMIFHKAISTFLGSFILSTRPMRLERRMQWVSVTIPATIMLLRDDRYALDDMILFIEDEQPTEDEIIEKTAEFLQK